MLSCHATSSTWSVVPANDDPPWTPHDPVGWAARTRAARHAEIGELFAGPSWPTRTGCGFTSPRQAAVWLLSLNQYPARPMRPGGTRSMSGFRSVVSVLVRFVVRSFSTNSSGALRAAAAWTHFSRVCPAGPHCTAATAASPASPSPAQAASSTNGRRPSKWSSGHSHSTCSSRAPMAEAGSSPGNEPAAWRN